MKEAIELAWYMRGSIQYKDFLEMTPAEKEIARDFIKDHMKSVEKHPFPVY